MAVSAIFRVRAGILAVTFTNAQTFHQLETDCA